MAGIECIKISCHKENYRCCSTGGSLMISLDEEIKKAIQEGFSEDNAVAKVCQDVILDAIISIPYYNALQFNIFKII